MGVAAKEEEEDEDEDEAVEERGDEVGDGLAGIAGSLFSYR